MESKYSNRYFKNQDKRNQIWRKFMNNKDVMNAIDRVKGSIAYMSQHHPHKLNKEDMEFMEIPLAELEIALRKIKNVPNIFDFDEDQLKDIHKTYEELKRKIEQIDIQRISWN
ncbi:hypothetical protein [Bacillus litorisediminis]|uniref:hypothetical protein n=1 Tax=Bacillus litorisediminis TaxID=2922713 RepID=UPI001FAFA696|nr:hypothetical protein [Bacillus litorisediminis]